MRCSLLMISASLVAMTQAVPSYAQERQAQAVKPALGEDETKQAIAQLADESAEQGGKVISNGSPNGRAGAGFSTTSLQFSNEQGETGVSLALSIDMGSGKPNPSSPEYYKVSHSRIGLVATVPFDKKSKNSPLFSGDSLVSGSKVKMSFTRVSADLGSGANSWVAINAAYHKCADTQTEIWRLKQPQGEQRDHVARTYLSYIHTNLGRPSPSNTPAFENIFKKAPGDKSLSAAVFAACVPGDNDDGSNRPFANEGDLVDAYLKGPEALAMHRAFSPDKARLTFMGLDASMGRDDHSFLDRTNFKLLSEPRTTWEVGAYYGWIGSDLTSSLRGRVVYGQTYKDNDEAEICRSVSIPVGGTDCIKGPDGAPIRERTGLASIEGRKLVTVNGKTQIALAPQVTYRFQDKNVGVEVPIYLVPDEKGKLSGGIKAVYNSKGDEFAVGLFVGVPFSIFFDS